MAKQMMQDIVVNNTEGEAPKETVPKESSPSRKPSPANNPVKPAVEEPLAVTTPAKKEEKAGYSPDFSSLETSPIFEKMKRRNKDRESLSDEFTDEKKGGPRRFFVKLTAVLVGLLLVGGFVFGAFFSKAVLTITEKHVDVALQNQEFLAGQGENLDALAFQLMSLSNESSRELVATGEKNVSNKASGKIVVYNDYGPQNQTLIKNTRFQSPDGKIYKIRDSIIVPGQKTVDGKKIPGSFEVEVYADAAGEEYNIGLVDFTIPGFKGSPRYDKFYARSKTEMTGGFSGLMKIVSPDDIAKAKEALTAELKDKLFAEASAQKPKGTVLYKDAVFYSFTDSMDNNAVDGKTVKLTLKGSLTAMLFSEEELSKHIVKASAVPVDMSPDDHIFVTNIGELAFVPKNTASVAPKEGEEYSFMLSGDAKAVWKVDIAALQGRLAGVKKVDYKNVFSEFPGIEKATASVTPFWKTKFPSDPAKIRVEIACDTPCQP